MNKTIINLIKLLSFVTTQLVANGISFPYPIAVNVGDEAKLIAGLLSNNMPRVFTGNDRIADILAELSRGGIDPVVYFFDGSFRAYSRFDSMISAIKAGQYNANDVKRLPVLLVDGPIPVDILDNVFYLEIEKNNSEIVNIWDVIPEAEELSLVYDKIGDLDEGLTAAARFIKAGICFLFPYMKRTKQIAEYEDIQKYADHLIELDYQAKDGYGIASAFVDAIYSYKDEGNQLGLICLPNVNTEAADKTEHIMFYDHKFLYISNALFSKITESIGGVVGKNRLKQILVEEGLLVKGRGATYTSKMNCYNQFGKLCRPDMLRFELSKLNLPGEMGLLDYYDEGGK